MTSLAWSAIATLTVFVLSNIGAMIYWSAKISTLLMMLERQVEQVVKKLDSFDGRFVTKEDLSARVAVSDKEHAAMWKRTDEVREMLIHCKDVHRVE